MEQAGSAAAGKGGPLGFRGRQISFLHSRLGLAELQKELTISTEFLAFHDHLSKSNFADGTMLDMAKGTSLERVEGLWKRGLQPQTLH